MPTDAIECPLCLGEGELKRTEVLDRLGVKDLARVAQLSAEEAFRLLIGKHKDDQQSVWLRFETELAKRMAEIRDRHKDESHATQSERDNLTRRVEDCLREVAQLRERNQELEAEMSKVSRIGKREEMDFADEARTWAGVSVSEKLPRNGDFIVAYRDPSGASVEPRMLVDNKDKAAVTEGDIAKLIRDAKERSLSVAVLVARTEEQLRQIDRECRWVEKDGVWILRTTRQCLPRDLEVLRPLLERMRTEGPDFLQRNAALAEEVRRTFADIEAIEKGLGQASKALQSVSGLVGKYKGRLQRLCENAPVQSKPSRSATVSSNDFQSAGA
jgi:predicted nuclease with TOPRIM domain